MLKKVIVFFILSFSFSFSLQATTKQDIFKFERKNFTVEVGNRFSFSLPEGEKGKWTLEVINKKMIKIVKREKNNDVLNITLSLIKVGSARLEAVLIKKNRVQLRRYYFLKIVPAKVKKVALKIKDDLDGKNKVKKKIHTIALRDFQLAKSIMDSGFYLEASRAFEVFTEKHPKSDLVELADIYRGKGFYRSGDISKALSFFKKGASSKKNRIKYLSSLWAGYCYGKLNQNAKAIRSFIFAMGGRAFPDIDIRARTGLALFYAGQKKYKLAARQFEKILFFMKIRKSKGSSYLFAFYYAAEFYESYSSIRDINKAASLYREFIQKTELKLKNGEVKGLTGEQLKHLLKNGRVRLSYLTKNYLNYR